MAVAEEAMEKRSKLPLALGLVSAVALGGGGFYAVYSGMVLGDAHKRDSGSEHEAHTPKKLPAMAFIPIPALLVSLSRTEPEQVLRFEGNLEVDPAYASEVESLMPRIMDVMNSYLRAVELEDLRDPSALLRLRSQMLRRVQVVTGEGRIRDLLVTTFLIS